MKLSLKIKSLNENVTSSPILWEGIDIGCTIGRNEACDINIIDPDKFVSSKHIEIIFDGINFQLISLGTNGTQVNEVQVRKGRQVLLCDKDILVFGDFEVVVNLEPFDSTLHETRILHEVSEGHDDPFSLPSIERYTESLQEETDPLTNLEHARRNLQVSEAFSDTSLDPDNLAVISPNPDHEHSLIPEDWDDSDLGDMNDGTSYDLPNFNEESTENVKKSHFPISKVIQDMPLGILMYNPPQKMKLGTKERVEVRISTKFMKELAANLKGAGKPQFEKLKISEFMKVKLIGNDFDILALSEEEQIVSDNDVTNWSWDITAKSLGLKEIHLKVTSRFKLETGQEFKDYPIIDNEIFISVNPTYSLRKFANTYWKWIMTSLLIPLLVWAWKSFVL
ncbi:FHA domain-containing protein [Aliikangiella coralliicola]|uniref:FHA domain-containing protein n=1 Tax=Aliikangiella coralliicola TaxID=2592383 RepID=A0A545U8P1_9GAMM|nr:FHA domain-containing protein [Aliikangiella coralliicola]TQV85840.1 FHA domain-containing protein [Aliikangiella coralliicola]